MLGKIASQCQFASETFVFSEGGMNIVSNTRMLLASRSPQIITIVPLKGRWDHISVWNLISFKKVNHRKLHHELVFNEPLLLHIGLVHIMSCHYHG
jgi:hypothetical protein